MFTSYYANLKKLPESLEPVCISVGKPKWFTGRVFPDLAPTRQMLKMPKIQYDILYAAILGKLDPREVYKALGSNAVLLCWEKPGEACHRRQVAEWLEKALKIEVPEYGFVRESTLAYDDSKWTGVKEATATKTPKKPAKGQPRSGLFLF